MAINPQAVRGPVTAVPVVAGTGVRLREDVENNRVVAEVDETVLWESSSTSGTSTYSTRDLVCSEDPHNFEKLKIILSFQSPCPEVKEIPMDYVYNKGNKFVVSGVAADSESNNALYVRDTWFSVTSTAVSATKSTNVVINNTSIADQGTNQYSWATVFKIIGINRISASA